MLGTEKEFDVTEARTHGPGLGVPMFKVECEDHSAIQAPVIEVCLKTFMDMHSGMKLAKMTHGNT